MGSTRLTEDSLAEQPALEWFRGLGCQTALGPDISPVGARPERDSFDRHWLTFCIKVISN